MRIAIIGAGLAGLSCARRLKFEGHDVVLFDKGRGPGGRMSTRRADTTIGQLRWDHGAQYFTARSDGFVAFVEKLVDQGAVAEWTGRLVHIDEAGHQSSLKDEKRYVGAPSMNQMIKALAADLDVSWGRRAAALNRSDDGWTISFETGETADGFDAVVVAVPAEQVPDLVRPVSATFADEADAASSGPCWAVMLAFDAPVDLPFDGAKLEGGACSWVARNAAKPGRGDGETWLLHGSPDWSRAHIEDEPETVTDQLYADFITRFGLDRTPIHRTAHRWRYAFIERSADTPFGWDSDQRLGVCGDWRIGPRVEFAWQSGDALAGAITES